MHFSDAFKLIFKNDLFLVFAIRGMEKSKKTIVIVDLTNVIHFASILFGIFEILVYMTDTITIILAMHSTAHTHTHLYIYCRPHIQVSNYVYVFACLQTGAMRCA